MTTNGTLGDERRVLGTILHRHLSQQSQIIRSQTTVTHCTTREERERTIQYIRECIPELSTSTLRDFAAKNQEQHDVRSVFELGSQFVAVTNEEFRQLLKDRGWQGLVSHHGGTKGVIECSRVGFNDDVTEALVYFGHQWATRRGVGSFRLFERNEEQQWVQIRIVRSWTS